jgi:serine/threonine-protein kinase
MSDETTLARPGGSNEFRAPLELTEGTVVGDWVIEAIEAAGGHGSVYRARHPKDGSLVAIKVLHPALLSLPHMAERFVREVEVILRLRHPNIVEVKDIGTLPDGTPYYVMEYLQGATLRDFIRERGRVSPAEALEIIEPVCAALETAHAAGIVHRDVKPGNIMIGEGEPRTAIKLLDFGIAKLVAPEAGSTGLTSIGQRLGTPAIMAPEQILGGRIDARTDIYALGALLYSLLTGRRPFESMVPGDLVQQHLEAPPPRPSQRAPISSALDAVVLRCLEKRPEKRFESVRVFLDALREAVHAAETPSSSDVERLAIGILVDARVREDVDGDDDELAFEVVQIIERAEECMRSGGFLLATGTSSQLLGLRLLSDDPGYARGERRAALEFALTLNAALRRDAVPGAPIHVNVAVHVDSVNVRLSAEPEITSGAIARTDTWAPARDVDGLCATPAAVEGLGTLLLEPGPDGLSIVRRPTTRKISVPSYTVISGDESSPRG